MTPRAVFELMIGAAGRQGFKFAGSDEGYRIDFEVAYGGDGEPPKSALTVYNPPTQFAESVRSWGSSAIVTLTGGIEGWSTGKIFSGNVVKDGVKVTKGPDYVLQVTCAAGHSHYVTSKVADSTSSTDTPQTLFARLCIALGVQPGVFDVPSGYSVTSRAMYGPPIHQLEALARSTGRRLVFDGDKMHLLAMDVGIVSGNTPLYRAGSGLIGTPESTEKGFDVKLLLAPAMRVGSRFVVEYEDPYSERPVRRVLVAKEVRHTGSTHASEVITAVKARAGAT